MRRLLKPPPADSRELFLESLEATGIELGLHDLQLRPLRFRVRALAVEGIGWHARLDGIKVAHVVSLQEAAGRKLDPVSLEISYGVERLALVEQGVSSIDDVTWSAGVSYGEVRRRDEEDFSHYHFEVADVDPFRSLVIGFLEHAEVLAPPDLRAAVVDWLTAMVEESAP